MTKSARSRVELGLRRMSWPTCHELARQLHLSDSTVRRHLGDLLREGLAERREDPNTPNPRGGGVDRWAWLETPLGPPVPTGQVLCDRCVEAEYGEPQRYQAALSERARERYFDLWLEELDSDAPLHRCEGCDGDLCPRTDLDDTTVTH